MEWTLTATRRPQEKGTARAAPVPLQSLNHLSVALSAGASLTRQPRCSRMLCLVEVCSVQCSCPQRHAVCTAFVDKQRAVLGLSTPLPLVAACLSASAALLSNPTPAASVLVLTSANTPAPTSTSVLTPVSAANTVPDKTNKMADIRLNAVYMRESSVRSAATSPDTDASERSDGISLADL
jgi:hypothetical protein